LDQSGENRVLAPALEREIAGCSSLMPKVQTEQLVLPGHPPSVTTDPRTQKRTNQKGFFWSRTGQRLKSTRLVASKYHFCTQSHFSIAPCLAPDIQRKPKVRAQPAAEDKKAKPGLTPSTLREFCGLLGLLEKPASTVIRQVVAEAAKSWPTLIAPSALTVNQKTKLLAHLETHPMVQSARKRSLPRKST
jgi:hypothetical protein